MLHVLIVADSLEDRLTARRLLQLAVPVAYSITEVEGDERALAACQSGQPDCVLLDWCPPDRGGPATLDALRAASDVPVVLLACAGSEAQAVEALERGAQDYLVKDVLTAERLHLSIQRAVATARLARERDQALALLTTVLNSMPVGITVLDPELRYVLINPVLAALNGRSPAEYLGRTPAEMVPSLAPWLEPTLRRVLASGEPLEGLELSGQPSSKDGRARDWLINAFALPGAAGGVAGVGVTVTNITETKRTTTGLQASEARFRLLAEHAQDVLYRVRPAPTPIVEYLSPSIERLTGYHRREFYRDPGIIRRLIHPDDLPIARRLFADGAALTQPITVRWQHLDGSSGWAELHSWLVTDEMGRPQAIEGIARDITQRKRDAAALVAHAEALSKTNAELTRALRLKDEFLAMMSHELRTPLTAILGISEALDVGLYGPIGEQQRTALARVTKSGQHLLSILSDILDLVHLESGQAVLQAQPIDVDCLCRGAIQFVQAAAQAKAISVRLNVPPDIEGAVADEDRLSQILVNLLDNAVKFTPAGGTVGLEVIPDSEQERIEFAVWDTGIGIATADLGRLFQPFTQVDGQLSRPYGGIGLGLTLVRRLVELHGGSISLTSTPGRGSRFTVSLPWYAGDGAAPQDGSVPELRASTHPPRLVIADDHEVTLQRYADFLSRQGFQVVTVRTAEEAMAQVRAACPELVVLDVQLSGMSWPAAIRQIREDQALAALPIIALSALVMPGDREQCLAAGANRYLPRPVSARTLAAIIAEVLDTAETSST